MKFCIYQWTGLLIALLCLSTTQNKAQVPQQITLDRANSQDRGNHVIELNNGDLLLIGTTQNTNGNSQMDGTLTRVNPNTGAVVWARAYSLNQDDMLSMAIQASNNSIIAVGRTIAPNTTNPSMWFLNVNANTGNVIASTAFHETEFSTLIHVIESQQRDSFNNPTFIAVGGADDTLDNNDNFDRGYIVHLDIDGNILWENEYNNGGTNNWFTEAVEIDSIIYACGVENNRPLVADISSTTGTIERAWQLSTGRTFNSMAVDSSGTNPVLVLGGLATNDIPLFVRLNPNVTVGQNATINRALEYLTPTPMHRITSLRPSATGGWMVNFRETGNGEIAFLDNDGDFMHQITYNQPNTWVNRLNPIGTNMVAALGWNNGAPNSPMVLNIGNMLGANGCSALETNIQQNSPNAQAFNRTINNPSETNQVSPLALATPVLNWTNNQTCLGCWTILDSNYLRLDPQNPDPRIADFGIIELGNNRFRIRNGAYNRLPEKLYLGNDVLLDIEAPTTLTTNTIVDLTNSDVVFGRGAGIRVQTGASPNGNRAELIINEATLRPCSEEDTWDGIVVSGARASLSCRASTFINATVALYVHNAADGSYTDNAFLNCQFGIVGNQNAWNSPITNNTFSINPAALNLVYTPLDEIQISNIGDSPVIWGNATNSFIQVNNRYFNANGNPTLTADNFQGFAAIELLGSINSSAISTSIISQNEFINGLPLADNNPEYNGILLSATRGINISQNRFTNNDRSVINHISQNNSIENNYMEVTRRSTVDRSFYQIVVVSQPNNSPGSSILIKGNTLINSAAPTDLSPNIIQQMATGDQLLNGTGAIYIHGSDVSPIRIADNSIIGFEVGIYKAGGRNSQIVNNRIQTHIIGIFQDRGAGLIGCNEIDMAAAANVPVIGISSEQTKLGDVSTILGNCIRNTDRAISLVRHRDATIEGLKSRIINNHLYNYSEAGIFLEDITNANSVASGTHHRIRRNAFLSNTGGSDIFLFSPIGNSLRVRADDNHVGADGQLDVVNATGNTQSGVFHGPSAGYVDWNSPLNNHLDLRPFAACGGMDATNEPLDSIIEADWATDCNDETFGNVTPILARVQNQVQLVANYQAVLSSYTHEEAASILDLSMAYLEDPISLNALFQAAQALDVDNNSRQWLNLRYHLQQSNWSSAKQALVNIQPMTSTEQERVAIKTAEINALTGAQNSPDLLEALQAIAHKHGLYKHDARSILNSSTNKGYSFEYNPLRLSKNVPTSFLVDNYNDAQQAMLLTPNPASNQVTIQISTQTNKHWTMISLYDIHGHLLQEKAIRAYQESLDVQTLPQGIYLISLKDAQGESVTQKFIKQ